MFHTKTVLISGASVAVLLAGAPAYAQVFPTGKVFDLTVGVNSSYVSSTDKLSGGIQTAPVGFTTVSEMFDNSKDSGLTNINSAYNTNSASVIRMGYRGLPLVVTTTAGSSQVVFSIPALNQVTVFSAKATRDGNVDDLREYLKSSGGAILDQLQLLLAKASPVDPIAGNPGSMQSQMVMADFDRNFTAFATNIKQGGESASNLIGLGASFGSFTQAGVTNQTVTLPLSYTFRSDLDPRRQLNLYAPISVTTVAGAKSFAANFGVSYRMPITDEWALTPGLGYGVSGSADLGSSAAMLAASVTSQYTIQRDGYDIAIGNTIGIYQSSKLSLGGYSFDPKISNTVFRNGILVSIPTTAFGQKMAYEISYINTLFTGTELYSKQYNEIGLTLGTNKSANSARSFLRAGASYLQGENGITGFRLNVGYWF